MKLLSLILVLVSFFSTQAGGQQISNAGLENWQTGTTMDPDSFWTSNIVIPHNSVTRTSDVHSGQYAARLESTNSVSATFAGLIVYGTGFRIGTPVGWPFTGQPQRLKYWYKYNPQNNDSGLAILYLFSQQAVVGSAVNYMVGTTATYTQADIPIQYFSSAQPDSLALLFSSGAGSPHVGSVLYVDDIALDYSSNSVEHIIASRFSIFPNPAHNVFTVEVDNPSQSYLTISDLSGKIVYRQSGIVKKTVVECDNWLPAPYVVRLSSPQGSYSTVFIRQD